MTRFEPISLEFSGRIVPKARRSGYLLFVYAPRCSLLVLVARCSLLDHEESIWWRSCFSACCCPLAALDAIDHVR